MEVTRGPLYFINTVSPLVMDLNCSRVSSSLTFLPSIKNVVSITPGFHGLGTCMVNTVALAATSGIKKYCKNTQANTVARSTGTTVLAIVRGTSVNRKLATNKTTAITPATMGMIRSNFVILASSFIAALTALFVAPGYT
jgi:hypothetical protein